MECIPAIATYIEVIINKLEEKVSEFLVKNSELAAHLKLSVTGDEMTALLVRWGVLVLDYADLPPGETTEYYNITSRYESTELGTILVRVKDKQDYSEPEWYWSESGLLAVAALFRKLQFMDCREIAELIIRESLNSGAGSLDATDDKHCCKNCATGCICR